VKFICNKCKNNCKIKIELEDGKIKSISGNKCKDGLKLAKKKAAKKIEKQ
jgi:CxxC motif-containing protein